MLQCLGHMRMAPIRVRCVKEPQSMLMAIQEQLGKSFDPERGLMRMMTRPHRTRSHGEPARLNPSAPERNSIGGGELLSQGSHGPRRRMQSC